jgi:hypothetical protein
MKQVEVLQPLREGESPVSDRKICGAKKRNGDPCRAIPMTNGRCRIHGGATPGGMALPQYKHGRYSKYLPTGLAEKYNNALVDTELVTLRDEIALVDSKIQETMETAKEEPISFDKLQPMIEQRRRLVESESKRLREMEHNLTVTQAMQIITLLADIVKRHVTDPKQLKAIQTELAETAYQ